MQVREILANAKQAISALRITVAECDAGNVWPYPDRCRAKAVEALREIAAAAQEALDTYEEESHVQ